MARKNSGFTMVELLAAIVVMGLMMMVAVPAVTRVVTNSKNNTYIDDAIRLVTTMDYEMRSNNKMPVPARGACIAMNLIYMDNNTFNDAPYEGEYERLASFVVARRDDAGNSYRYYVRLIEKLPESTGYRGVDLEELESLYENDAKQTRVKSIGKSKVFSLTDYIYKTTDLKNELSTYGISCSNLIIYAPDDTKLGL